MPDTPTWYIIVRNPYYASYSFHFLANKLRCKGYDLSKEKFIATNQGAGCAYFDGPAGFEYVTIPSAGGPPAGAGGPPPGVAGAGGAGDPPPGVAGAGGPPPGVADAGEPSAEMAHAAPGTTV